MGGCWRLSDCQACGTAEGVSRDESFATGSFGRECMMGPVMGERRRSLRLRVATDGGGIGMVDLYGTPEGVP